MWDLHSHSFVVLVVLNMLVVLHLFGFVFLFQYNGILDQFQNTASAALAAVCPGVSGTEPKLVPVCSQSSSLAAFVTWICLLAFETGEGTH